MQLNSVIEASALHPTPICLPQHALIEASAHALLKEKKRILEAPQLAFIQVLQHALIQAL